MKFLTSIDLSQNEIQNAIMQPLAAPPSNPKLGQIYFNSIDLTLYLWTGEKWIPVPTKLSQLENDSKFITAKDVPEGAAASTTTPKMNGTAAVGTEMAFARGDHVHPKDTSKLNTDGDGSNVTVAFEAAAKREAPVSGEKLSVLLGKVLKFFSDLKTVAFSGSYKDLSDKPTIPSAAADVGAIPATEKGAAGGVAALASGGQVPATPLPSYVDDVVDAYIRTGVTALGANWLSKTSGGAALTPESDKIYVILSEGEYQNKTYRWSGTTYAVIGNDLAIGETASTASRGDRGKPAYAHSQSAHAPADAEKNVQSDWNETDGTSDAYNKHQPVFLLFVFLFFQTFHQEQARDPEGRHQDRPDPQRRGEQELHRHRLHPQRDPDRQRHQGAGHRRHLFRERHGLGQRQSHGHARGRALQPDPRHHHKHRTVRRPAYETLRSSRRPEGHHDEGVCRRG